MGMTIIKDYKMPHNCYDCDLHNYHECNLTCESIEDDYCWNGDSREKHCPLREVEAIPKDQYEARLNADLKAMLEDLDLKIDEMYEPQFSKEGMDGFYWAQGLFKALVQEEINALKEAADDK